MTQHRTNAGSMTTAMSAIRASAHGPKVLRVGVIEGTRVTEERVFRDGASVTIGSDPACTFAVNSEGAPESLALFSRRDGAWVLSLASGVDGRVLLDGKVQLVGELRASSNARELTLSDSARGKVTFAGVTVLFQFVEAPPIAPKPQLPQAIRAQPLREMDWTYNACLAGFLAVAFSGMGFLEYGYDPMIDELDVREELRMVQVAPAPSEPEPAPQEAAAAPDSPANTPAPSNTARNNNSTTPTRRPAAAHPSAAQSPEDRVAAAIAAANRAADATLSGLSRSSEFINIANALGPGSAAAMIRNGQGLMDGSVAALAGTTGITTATGNNGGIQRTGLVASNVRGPATLGGNQRIDRPGEIGNNTVAPVERVVIGRVASEAVDLPPHEPGLPMNEVAAVFRRNLGAIQGCYTSGLRNNAGLRGRIEVEFTIGTSGRVLGAPSVRGLANGDDVHQCVSGRVRRYVFPALSESTNVSFGVSLTPGS